MTEEKTFNLSESVFGGKSREVLTIINRNAVTGKKQTSFNRGVQVRRDFIPQLIAAEVLTCVAVGVVSVDTSDILVAFSPLVDGVIMTPQGDNYVQSQSNSRVNL